MVHRESTFIIVSPAWNCRLANTPKPFCNTNEGVTKTRALLHSGIFLPATNTNLFICPSDLKIFGGDVLFEKLLNFCFLEKKVLR